MSIAIKCNDCPSFYVSYNKEFSEGKIWETTATRDTYLNEVIVLLNKVYNDSSKEDWDGYGAKPVAYISLLDAKKFIQLLPSSFPIPEVLSEPSGEIGLEWYKDKQLIFAISFNGRNTITYAGMFGSNKTHGVEYFGDTIPSIISDNLKRLYF